MTGCLYISPPSLGASDGGVIPMLFADTLVTFSAAHLVSAPSVTPATVPPEGRSVNSRVALTRKLHIVDSPKGTTAVAFAGEGPSIRECLGTLKWNIEDWERYPRPMRAFGDNVNLYKGKVEAIGVYAYKDEPNLNSMARSRPYRLQNLGMCMSIGTGDRDLEAIARGYDASLSRQRRGAGWLVGLSNAITGERLAREIRRGQTNSWGGYLEMAYFCPNTRKWRRGSSVLHYFFITFETCDGEIGVSIIPRVIAYEPGDETGYVLSVYAEHGDVTGYEFRLRSTSEANPKLHDWKSWRPEMGALTFLHSQGEKLQTVTVTVGPSNLDALWFNLNDGAVKLGVDEDLLQKVVDEIISRRWRNE